MKDHYKEYMEAGVMPGNLENDRLLTDEEMNKLQDQPILVATKEDSEKIHKYAQVIRKAQLAKADKWLFEWLNKHNDFNEFGVVTGSGLLLTIKDWQALKKQIGGK